MSAGSVELDKHLARLSARHRPVTSGCSCGHGEYPEHWATLVEVVRGNLAHRAPNYLRTSTREH